MTQRIRFVVHVGVATTVIIVGVFSYASLRVFLLRNDARDGIAHAQQTLRTATDELRRTADTVRNAEERLATSRALLGQGSAYLAEATDASRAYAELADASFPILRFSVRSLDPPVSVPASVSSAITTLSSRVAWRIDALAALRKLAGYDPATDIGSLAVPRDARELIRRLYFAKAGMSRASTALADPPFAEESEAVAGTTKALSPMLDVIDRLIVALDTERWDQAAPLLERLFSSVRTARNNAESAFTLLAADGSLSAMAGTH